ncbi:MAG: ATP-binding protein [Myxococcota bacterium]
MEREQKQAIIRDLSKKLVLLAGPRQAGKTTLAKEIGAHFENSVYLNYDRLEDRNIIKQEAWLPKTDLLILDEIHKMPKWKNYLKGVFDTKNPHLKILVTGSARLDIFRQAGDSLAGRYYLHHLLPLSPAELVSVGHDSDINRFLERGGFPEPYLAADLVDAKRWRLQYVDSLFREEILSMENVHDLRAMQLIFELLRKRVGSAVSYVSLAEDVGISVNTVKRYIGIFEALYLVFRVTPFSNNIARSLLKEPKIYFFDVGLVDGDIGAKLENLFAVSLLKYTLLKTDYAAEPYALHYLRTKEKQKVDFAICNGGKVEQIIEVKTGDKSLSRELIYFHSKYGFPTTQAVLNLKRERMEKGISVRTADDFLEKLQGLSLG